jgi:hypothetical protein
LRETLAARSDPSQVTDFAAGTLSDKDREMYLRTWLQASLDRGAPIHEVEGILEYEDAMFAFLSGLGF